MFKFTHGYKLLLTALAVVLAIVIAMYYFAGEAIRSDGNEPPSHPTVPGHTITPSPTPAPHPPATPPSAPTPPQPTNHPAPGHSGSSSGHSHHPHHQPPHPPHPPHPHHHHHHPHPPHPPQTVPSVESICHAASRGVSLVQIALQHKVPFGQVVKTIRHNCPHAIPRRGLHGK